jgi:hypothetical protein
MVTDATHPTPPGAIGCSLAIVDLALIDKELVPDSYLGRPAGKAGGKRLHIWITCSPTPSSAPGHLARCPRRPVDVLISLCGFAATPTVLPTSCCLRAASRRTVKERNMLTYGSRPPTAWSSASVREVADRVVLADLPYGR